MANTALTARNIRFWFDEGPLLRLAVFRITIASLALWDAAGYAALVFSDAQAVAAGTGTRPWSPIYLFEILQLGPIDLRHPLRVALALPLALLVLYVYTLHAGPGLYALVLGSIGVAGVADATARRAPTSRSVPLGRSRTAGGLQDNHTPC